MHDIGKIGIPDSVLLKPEGSPRMNGRSCRHTRCAANASSSASRPTACPTSPASCATITSTSTAAATRTTSPANRFRSWRASLRRRQLRRHRHARPYHASRNHDEVIAILEAERGGKHDPICSTTSSAAWTTSSPSPFHAAAGDRLLECGFAAISRVPLAPRDPNVQG